MSIESGVSASSSGADSVADEEELKQLNEAIAELSDRFKQRSSLYESNLKAVRERSVGDDDDRFAGRDASLKKNTAFVKKLRTFTEKQKDDLLKELANLNLTRYIGEAAQAICEAKPKMSDAGSLVALCSALHREYTEFSSVLLQQYTKTLQASATLTGPTANSANLTRLRVDLRVFAELIVVGVFTGQGEREALATLNSVVSNCATYARTDVEQEGACAQAVAPAIVNLVRLCGDELLGLTPQRQLAVAERRNVVFPRASPRFTTGDACARHLTALGDVVRSFFATLSDCVQHTARRVRAMERANVRQLETHGEVSADRQTALEAARTALIKASTNAAILADYLHAEPPAFLAIDEEAARAAPATQIAIGMPASGQDTGSNVDVLMENLFEDDDARQFYTKLPDLRCLLPAKEPKKDDRPEDASPSKAAQEHETQPVGVSLEEVEREIEIEQAETQAATDEAPVDAAEMETDDGTDAVRPDQTADRSESDRQTALAAASRSMRAQFDAFLETLPRCVNRDLIDRAAAEFLTCHNCKANRRRLVSTLFAAPRTRYDLLAFYARLAALLNQCYPTDIGTPLCTQLASELRWHVRKKDQTNIEAKLKTVRFIGELVKFAVFDPQDALRLVSTLLGDFTHHNVEMLCALLESAGRYLCRLDCTRQRARVLLQVVQRKTDIKRATLDARYPPLIESAIAVALKDIEEDLGLATGGSATPREDAAPPAPLPVQFARNLLIVDLATERLDPERVLRCLRRLDWSDPELRRALTRLFSEAAYFRYTALDRVACVLQGIASYYPDVAVSVVDNVIEEIRFGMQCPDPRLHQRRVAFARYFAELYNYRLIDSTVVFKVLYSLITFGVIFDERVRTGIPKPEETESNDAPPPPIVFADAMSLDPADHCLRIRLVCVVLDACGAYFNQGKFAEKLDCFLIYFQRYCWYKRVHPIWNSTVESNFPNEYIFTYQELFEKLRPKWRHVARYEAACCEVEKLEQSLGEKIATALRNAEEQKASSGLAVIGEDENENDSESEGYREEGNAFESGKRDMHGNENDSESDTVTCSASRNESEDEMDDEGQLDISGEALDEQATLKALEDAAFASELERAISDSFQSRLGEARNVQGSEIPLPVSVKDVQTPVRPAGAQPNTDSTVPFKVMMRRPNNKQQPQLAVVNIPAEEQLAAQFLRHEQHERFEKEQVKRAVLGIHERQKAEELQFEELRRSHVSASDGDRPRRF